MIKSAYVLTQFFLQWPRLVIRKNRVPFSNRISSGVFISESKLGKYNFVGRNSLLRLTDMGNYCSIASGVQIGGMEHPYRLPSTSPLLFDISEISNERTLIEDDVWIGANAVIRRGVHIGRGAVIGSASVVLSDVPAYSIVVGIPAQEKKMRFCEKTIKMIEETKYWLLKPKEAKRVLSEINHSKV